MSLKNKLFKASRTLNKISRTIGDVETIASGDPKKITKRFANRAKNKALYSITNKIKNKTDIK